jgi:hypothetical protein
LAACRTFSTKAREIPCKLTDQLISVHTIFLRFNRNVENCFLQIPVLFEGQIIDFILHKFCLKLSHATCLQLELYTCTVSVYKIKHTNSSTLSSCVLDLRSATQVVMRESNRNLDIPPPRAYLGNLLVLYLKAGI